MIYYPEYCKHKKHFEKVMNYLESEECKELNNTEEIDRSNDYTENYQTIRLLEKQYNLLVEYAHKTFRGIKH